MTDDWDLRSNIKNKPGSQGTLFSGGKSQLNPQRRYPRGYTPQRQAEVVEALRGTTVRDRVSHPVRVKDPQPDAQGNVRYVRYPQAEARIVDTVARSTIPPEHLAGINVIHDAPGPGHHATYWPGSQEIGVTMLGTKPTSTGRSYQDEGEHSLIHEIGHHVDKTQSHESEAHVAQGVSANVKYAGVDPIKIRSGIAEAVADNYYVTHFRGRGRKGTAPTEGHYEANFEPNTLDQRYPGYTDVRPPKEFSAARNLSSQFQDTLF